MCFGLARVSSSEELESVASELDLYVLVRLFLLLLRDALLDVLLSLLRLDEIRHINTSWDSSVESNSKVCLSRVSLEWILEFVSGSSGQQEVLFAVLHRLMQYMFDLMACGSFLPNSTWKRACLVLQVPNSSHSSHKRNQTELSKSNG